jgi:DNA-binding transcriptional LysR family regulator
LATHPIIGLTRESGIRRLVDHWSSSLGIELRYSFTVQSINTVLSMVNSNLGIAILPSYAMALKGDKNIQILELTDPVIERDISLIKRRGRSLSPAAIKFSQVVRKWVRNQFPNVSAQDDLDQGST